MVQSVTTAKEINVQARAGHDDTVTCADLRKRDQRLRRNDLPTARGNSNWRIVCGDEVQLLTLRQFSCRCTLRPTSEAH